LRKKFIERKDASPLKNITKARLAREGGKLKYLGGNHLSWGSPDLNQNNCFLGGGVRTRLLGSKEKKGTSSCETRVVVNGLREGGNSMKYSMQDGIGEGGISLMAKQQHAADQIRKKKSWEG